MDSKQAEVTWVFEGQPAFPILKAWVAPGIYPCRRAIDSRWGFWSDDNYIRDGKLRNIGEQTVLYEGRMQNAKEILDAYSLAERITTIVAPYVKRCLVDYDVFAMRNRERPRGQLILVECDANFHQQVAAKLEALGLNNRGAGQGQFENDFIFYHEDEESIAQAIRFIKLSATGAL